MRFNSDFYEVRELGVESPYNKIAAFQDDKNEAEKFKKYYETKNNIKCEVVKIEL